MSGGGTGGGRTRITTRALERVTAAVTAEALDAHGVGVTLADDSGALDIRVSTTIRSVPLESASAATRAGGSILDRTTAAESTIRERVQVLTGSSVRRVTVRITGVEIRRERRVR